MIRTRSVAFVRWLAALACVACCALPALVAAGVVGGVGWTVLTRSLPAISVALVALAVTLTWWAGRRSRCGSASAGCDGGSCGC